MSVEDVSLSSPEATEILTKISSLKNSLEDEQNHEERQRQENVRRRHNFIPFIMVVLKYLAKKGKVSGMVERGRAEVKKRNRSTS